MVRKQLEKAYILSLELSDFLRSNPTITEIEAVMLELKVKTLKDTIFNAYAMSESEPPEYVASIATEIDCSMLNPDIYLKYSEANKLKTYKSDNFLIDFTNRAKHFESLVQNLIICNSSIVDVIPSTKRLVKKEINYSSFATEIENLEFIEELSFENWIELCEKTTSIQINLDSDDFTNQLEPNSTLIVTYSYNKYSKDYYVVLECYDKTLAKYNYEIEIRALKPIIDNATYIDFVDYNLAPSVKSFKSLVEKTGFITVSSKKAFDVKSDPKNTYETIMEAFLNTVVLTTLHRYRKRNPS